MDYAILGPLTVSANGDVVPLGPAKHRALLAVLLLHANEVVSSERLIDELWGEHPPPSAPKLVQVYVSQLRKALGEGAAIRTRPPGYVLEAGPEELDASRFEALVSRGRALAEGGDADLAVAAYDAALSLWRGSVLADVAFESFAAMEKDRLEELRLAALAERTECELALGHHERVVGMLEALAAEYPLRERFRAQLMLALYRSGRQADALAAYRDARRTLVGEVGIEPGPELRSLEAAILRHDPALDLRHSRAPAPPPAAATGGGAPAAMLEAAPGARRRWAGGAAALGAIVLVALAAAAVVVRDDPARLLEPRSAGRIDPGTNRIVTEVPLESAPVRMAGDGRAIWIAGREGTLSRLDPRRGRVVATLALRAPPSSLAAGLGSVWVGDGVAGAIVRVDPRHVVVAGRTRVPAPRDLPPGPSVTGERAPSIAVGGGWVWVSRGRATLRRVDGRTGRVTAVVRPARGATEALAYGEGALWLGGGNAVSRVSPMTLATTSVIRVPANPSVIATGAGAVWIALHRRAALLRIDPRTEAVTTTALDAPVTALCVRAGAVWAATATRAEVVRIDPETGRAVARIPTGATPTSLAPAPDGVWVGVI